MSGNELENYKQAINLTHELEANILRYLFDRQGRIADNLPSFDDYKLLKEIAEELRKINELSWGKKS